MQWVDRKERTPPANTRVLVLMDAGRVGNPFHPGYPDGRWVEISSALDEGRGLAGGMFGCEIIQTGVATHWAEIPADFPERPNT